VLLVESSVLYRGVDFRIRVSQSSPSDRACPDCQKEGVPYRVQAIGKRTLIYMRCLACGLEWTVERTQFLPPTDRSTKQ